MIYDIHVPFTHARGIEEGKKVVNLSYRYVHVDKTSSSFTKKITGILTNILVCKIVPSKF